MKKINKLCIRRFEIVRVKKMTKKHYEVVAAVIMKNETIFCCQRGNKGECAYKWEFPGGKIESGETKEEALIREIKEELDSIIKINKHLTTIDHEYNSSLITIHAYECELVKGELEISEHFDSRWLKKEELIKLDFAEADKKIIQNLF